MLVVTSKMSKQTKKASVDYDDDSKRHGKESSETKIMIHHRGGSTFSPMDRFYVSPSIQKPHRITLGEPQIDQWEIRSTNEMAS